jgi:glyoxylase I family protein
MFLTRSAFSIDMPLREIKNLTTARDNSQATKGEIVQESEFDNSPEVDQAVGLVNAKARMAMLKGPNAFLELWQYTNPEPKDLRSRPCDYGYPHFALQVDDIQVEYDRLKTHGMEFVGDVVHFGNTSSAIYGRDPCGNVIELYEIKAPEIAQLER